MKATERSRRRQVPVRLADVPLEIRLKAAQEEARSARTQEERDELLATAKLPPGTVFYVTDGEPRAA